MTLFASLTNRIFLACALLAVVAIGVSMYNVNTAVSSQAEQELRLGVDEAGTLVDEYRRLLLEHASREARLVADLPRLKATVELRDPPTAQPLVEVYREQLDATLLLVTGADGQVLGRSTAPFSELPVDVPAGVQDAVRGKEASSLRPHPGGILQVVTVPIWIDPLQPQILGTLSVGFSLDNTAAARFRSLTNSEIAFGMNGAIHASTLDKSRWPALSVLLDRPGLTPAVPIGDEDYIALTRPLPAPVRTEADGASGPAPAAMVVILRSRTERLRVLNALHRTLIITAIVAVLAATLLSYGVARTVTRPLGTITTTMRDMAATGDLTRRIPQPSGARWEDEDARVLATTFNRLTDSIARFQREAGQRERLSSLGRLSTVVAHEIRNPLMIIKASLRSLRREPVTGEDLRRAVADIDEEVVRLNRIVSEVLDFARPIRFELAPADLNDICRDAARASMGESAGPPPRLTLGPDLPPLVTDAERLRLALVNVLTNARHAVADRFRDAEPPPDAVTLRTSREGGRARIEVCDRGAGIAEEDLPRVFDPYFTTRRTGTGLGLAITRNIVEGLGGTIAVASRPGAGTDVRIELTLKAD